MAKQVLLNATISVNGTDISDHCRSVTLEDKADTVELSAFGDTYKEYGQGLKDATITAEVFQDFAASSVDSVCQPLYASGGTFDVIVKSSSAATSATNPKYTLTSRMFEYTPLNGAVGDANTTSIVFQNAGTAGLVRGTA